jgi:hypothetical protein
MMTPDLLKILKVCAETGNVDCSKYACKENKEQTKPSSEEKKDGKPIKDPEHKTDSSKGAVESSMFQW